VTGSLFLRNDDYPGDFTSRRIEVLARVRVSGQESVLVSIEPELVDMPGGPLARAILVPRGLHASADDLWRGTLSEPIRVFVCRIKKGVDQAKQEYALDEVNNLLWGRVEDKKHYKS
jgi:hypothetical protein